MTWSYFRLYGSPGILCYNPKPMDSHAGQVNDRKYFQPSEARSKRGTLRASIMSVWGLSRPYFQGVWLEGLLLAPIGTSRFLIQTMRIPYTWLPFTPRAGLYSGLLRFCWGCSGMFCLQESICIDAGSDASGCLPQVQVPK